MPGPWLSPNRGFPVFRFARGPRQGLIWPVGCCVAMWGRGGACFPFLALAWKTYVLHVAVYVPRVSPTYETCVFAADIRFFSRGRHAFGQTYKTYVLHSWPCKTYETYVLHVGRTVSRARTFIDTRKAGVPKRAEHKARRKAHPHREHAEHLAHTERPRSLHRTRAAHTRNTQNP